MTKTTLPTDSQARKDIPLRAGCYNYFPAALAGVARWSKLGNDKHNPGQPLHHARGKSSDHEECIERHGTDLADLLAAESRTGEDLTAAILDELDARAWRALAASQELREARGLAPLAPGAKLPEEPAAQVLPPVGVPTTQRFLIRFAGTDNYWLEKGQGTTSTRSFAYVYSAEEARRQRGLHGTDIVLEPA